MKTSGILLALLVVTAALVSHAAAEATAPAGAVNYTVAFTFGSGRLTPAYADKDGNPVTEIRLAPGDKVTVTLDDPGHKYDLGEWTARFEFKGDVPKGSSAPDGKDIPIGRHTKVGEPGLDVAVRVGSGTDRFTSAHPTAEFKEAVDKAQPLVVEAAVGAKPPDPDEFRRSQNLNGDWHMTQQPHTTRPPPPGGWMKLKVSIVRVDEANDKGKP